MLLDFNLFRKSSKAHFKLGKTADCRCDDCGLLIHTVQKRITFSAKKIPQSC